MTYSNVDQLNLGLILQIAFSTGIRTQISKDYRDWDMVSRMRIANTLARELRFMTQSSFGPAAIQEVSPGTTNRAFPQAQQASVSENTAKLKEIDATIEIEHNLWERAAKSPEKYGEPLALEMESKMTSAKRLMASRFYGDGSGVVCQVLSHVDTVGSGAGVDKARVTTDETDPGYDTSPTGLGFIGNCQMGDLLVPHTTAGATNDPTVTGTFYAYKVIARSRRSNWVDLQPVNSAGAALAMAATNLAATNLLYRVGQRTVSDVPDLTAAALYNGTTDWGSFTNIVPGLEVLTNNISLKCHGVVGSGATAGSRLDAGTALLDVELVHEMLDELKVNVGEGVYSWKILSMAPEGQRSFITSRETDRRFISAQDGARGTPKFSYIHRNDVLEIYVSEFIKKNRIFALPENKSAGQRVLEFWGTDFNTVKGQGTGDFHLKPSSSGGYLNMMISYLRSYCTLICKHNASIGVLTNFTL